MTIFLLEFCPDYEEQFCQNGLRQGGHNFQNISFRTHQEFSIVELLQNIKYLKRLQVHNPLYVLERGGKTEIRYFLDHRSKKSCFS